MVQPAGATAPCGYGHALGWQVFPSRGILRALRVLLGELREVVVRRAEALLHHHRREGAVRGAGHVRVVEDVPDLVVDRVLAVEAELSVERAGAAHPARAVDEHAPDVGLPARRLVPDRIAALPARGHLRRQADAEVGVAGVDAPHGDLARADPAPRVGERGVDGRGEGLVALGEDGAVLDLHGVRVDPARAGLGRGARDDVPRAGARHRERAARGQLRGGDVDVLPGAGRGLAHHRRGRRRREQRRRRPRVAVGGHGLDDGEHGEHHERRDHPRPPGAQHRGGRAGAGSSTRRSASGAAPGSRALADRGGTGALRTASTRAATVTRVREVGRGVGGRVLPAGRAPRRPGHAGTVPHGVGREPPTPAGTRSSSVRVPTRPAAGHDPSAAPSNSPSTALATISGRSIWAT